MMGPTPRRLVTDDVDEAAAAIAAAYVDDPLCAFMLPWRLTRQASLRKFFRAYGVLCARQGALCGIGAPLEAVAIWNTPAAAAVSVTPKTAVRFLPLLATMYPIGLVRARAAIAQQTALRQQHAPGPHYYLDNVAVLPACRGRGLASALIRPMLAAADCERVAVYTDTYTASNVPMYEHLGFVCVDQRSIPDLGLTIWALRRAAAAR